MRAVIIGNGVAGMEAALTLREREQDWDITIVSEETDNFFSRTALMWVVSGQLSQQCIEPLERDVYARLGFSRVRARAVAVDAERRVVKLATGDTLAFDRLLIACGSRPRRGPWEGHELAGIGHFVTMQDLEWLETELYGGPSRGGRPLNPDAHLQATTDDSPYLPREARWAERGGPPAHPIVIGGGLIGIEAVEVMHAAGLRPRFFIREEWFWPLALDSRESAWIAARMREHGVEAHLGENVERFEGEGHLQRVVTDLGSYDADLAVVAIGVVPNTQWLSESGIALDRSGGVLVDPAMRAQAPEGDALPGVYAAGDCASVRWFNGWQRPEQLWYTGRKQGRLAARSMLGDRVEYERGLWYNSAKLFDIEYTTAGLVNMNVEDERQFYFEEKGKVRSTNRIVLSGERVVGFNFLGRRWDHEVLLGWIRERRSLKYVLRHLRAASFDTEFVPPIAIPSAPRELDGPGPSNVSPPSPAPAL